MFGRWLLNILILNPVLNVYLVLNVNIKQNTMQLSSGFVNHNQNNRSETLERWLANRVSEESILFTSTLQTWVLDYHRIPFFCKTVQIVWLRNIDPNKWIFHLVNLNQ